MSQNNEILWEIKFTRLFLILMDRWRKRIFPTSIHTCLWESRLEGKLWGHEKKGLQERTVGADFLNVPSWSRRGTWEPGGRMLRTLRSSMMTPIFLILITNKIYTMTIAINQWMSLFPLFAILVIPGHLTTKSFSGGKLFYWKYFDIDIQLGHCMVTGGCV